ncbi:MAG: 16S rRNA (guanine(966)-N(2))-methyltransferase RsmD [Balneolaceae bacterium]|nr:MAG: 16S rRNA (guanine(966)-N(2))-methyltransferase RsmD [Balneolaceae bacterium]
MRIITGKLKGRSIPVPATDLLRPTSDRTKEGLFSVLNARIYFDGLHVLDLFAGSGNLGFEALSRGAESCLFVDSEPLHIRQIEKTAAQFGVSDKISTRIKSTELFLEQESGSYDLIFSDPPYDYFQMEEMIQTIMSKNWLSPDGWFILEHDKRHDFSSHPLSVFSKAYGRTIVSIFREKPLDS